MKEKIVNIMGLLLPAILLLVLSISFIRGISRNNQTEKIILKTEERLKRVQEEKIRLEQELKIVESQEFVEEQLRNKLGLVREGELILILPDEETLKKLAPNISEEEKTKPLPNWRKWVNLFM